MSKLAYIREVVQDYGLSASTWRRLADAKRVRSVRINGMRVLDREDCARIAIEGVPKDAPLPDTTAARAATRRANADFRAGYAR